MYAQLDVRVHERTDARVLTIQNRSQNFAGYFWYFRRVNHVTRRREQLSLPVKPHCAVVEDMEQEQMASLQMMQRWLARKATL